jgi:hypothetical protein
MDKPLLRVIDALDHPHGGRILRTRLAGDAVPALGELKGARFRARSPEGDERSIRVLGFPITGGKPSSRRIRETGRVDLHVEEAGEGVSVGLQWELIPAR